MIQNVLMAIITAFFFVLYATTKNNSAFVGVDYVFAGVALTMLIITALNLMRGRTCKCYLQTAVQTERLYSLHHIKTAKKVFKRLQKVVETVQGPLTQEMAQEEALGFAENVLKTTAHNPLNHGLQIPAKKQRKYYHGRPQEILFLLLLLDVLLSGLEFVSRSPAIPLLSSFLLLAIIVFIIVSLVKLRNTSLSDHLMVLVCISLGYIFISFFAGTICMSFFAIQHHELIKESSSQLSAWAAIDPSESIMKTVLLGVSMLCSGLLGILGLFSLWRYRRHEMDTSTFPPIPPVPSEEKSSP